MRPRKLVCGVGNNNAGYVVLKYGITDIGGKQKRKRVWICPYYQVWKTMLERCYSARVQERSPTYIGCTVTDDWLTFTNFKNWMVTQNWEGLELDKDILIEGNKAYSPETCVFVTGAVNKFTTDCGSARGELLLGVSWNKAKGKFRVRCRNPSSGKQEYLGLFTSEQEAHQAWRKRKNELAHELAAIQTDQRVAKALIDRYSNYTRVS